MKIYNPRTHIGALKFPLALLLRWFRNRQAGGSIFYTRLAPEVGRDYLLSQVGTCPAPLLLDMCLRYLAIFEDKSQYFQQIISEPFPVIIKEKRGDEVQVSEQASTAIQCQTSNLSYP